MTTLKGAEQAPADDPAADHDDQAEAEASRAESGHGSAQPRPVLRGVAVGLALLAVFLLGFLAYLYGFSRIEEARSQTTLYSELKLELANDVAPLGPTALGSPVAIIDIPSIGVRNVVIVQGTSAENLTLGPGHRPDTPLPGQAGVSVVFGRQATFGAPFARLSQLRRGNKIQVITGQGTSSYTVEALGDSSHLVEDPGPNRLILLTAGSSYAPDYYSYVDADLASAAHPASGVLPAISRAETALSGDDSALVLAMVWAIALVLVSAAGTLASVYWRPWLAYLAAAPVLLAVLWNLYQSLAALLPNVY